MAVDNKDTNSYYEVKAVSQTTLKALNKGVYAYKKFKDAQEQGGIFYTDSTLFYKESEGIIYGEAVDFLLSYGKERFDSVFCVLDAEKPGAKALSVCQKAIESLEITLNNMEDDNRSKYKMDTFKDVFIEAMQEESYRSNWSVDKRYGALKRESEGYWEELVNAFGKHSITKYEYDRIIAIYTSLKKHPTTSKYVNLTSSKDVEVIDQMQLYWMEKVNGLTIQCKGMLDRVIINHVKKLIMPIDYKVTFNRLDKFEMQFKKLRYDVQSSFYTRGLEKYIEQNNLDGYTVVPFKFIIENYNNVGQPVIVTVDKSTLEKGKNGYINSYGDKVDGWIGMLERYAYHEKNNQWDVEMEILQNKNNFTWILK